MTKEKNQNEITAKEILNYLEMIFQQEVSDKDYNKIVKEIQFLIETS